MVRKIKTYLPAKQFGRTNKLKFDRKSLLINLGGGLVSDLGGFISINLYERDRFY